MSEPYRSGYVSLVGRPNVGKSTLLNVFLGQKIAIVTEKPQTTRNRILGIRTFDSAQIIFIDTPGIHAPRHMLGETMLKTAHGALKGIDLILFVTEPGMSTHPDEEIIKDLRQSGKPVILVINKIDMVKKEELLPVMELLGNLFPFQEIVPISALRREGTDILLQAVMKYLPEGPQYYPDDQITDQIERVMVAEIIREKIMKRTSDEIPYSAAVDVLKWTEREDGVIYINANIYVEREGQKGIIIGKNGKMLKLIGTLARQDIERLLNAKVFLELWVKVKKGWRNNKIALDELGY